MLLLLPAWLVWYGEKKSNTTCKSRDFIQEVFEEGVYYKIFLKPKVAPMGMPMRSQQKQSVSIRAGVLVPRF